MTKSLIRLMLVVCLSSVGSSAAERHETTETDPIATNPKGSPTVVPVGATTQTPANSAVTARVASPSSSATGEQIKWQVISGGGDRGTSASYILSGTVGQTAVGPATSTSFEVNSGFWQNFSGGGCCVGATGNIDCDPGNGIDISDLSRLIDFLYISFTPLCCGASANTDGDPGMGIDISDLSRLIDFLYISFNPTAACP
jgi:hypothetical protein